MRSLGADPDLNAGLNAQRVASEIVTNYVRYHGLCELNLRMSGAPSRTAARSLIGKPYTKAGVLAGAILDGHLHADQFRQITGAHALHHPGAMNLHGTETDAEARGDLLIGDAGRCEF